MPTAPRAVRRLFSCPTEPVEVLIAIVTLTRGLIALSGLNLTAQTLEPAWVLDGYVAVGLLHLAALLADPGEVLPSGFAASVIRWCRQACAFLEGIIWAGIAVQFAVRFKEVTTSFPTLAVFSIWVYLRLAVITEAAKRCAPTKG